METPTEYLKPQVKIYGERNTGTNYLQELIALNLDADLLTGVAPLKIRKLHRKIPGRELLIDAYFLLTFRKNLGWKHALISLDVIEEIKKNFNRVHFITITKNPYSWALSLYRKPYHYQEKRKQFEEFLVTPWKTVGRERTRGQFKNPIDMWNQKNKSYILLNRYCSALNIKYEELIQNPEKIIWQISQKLSLKAKTRYFTNVDRSTKEKNKDFNYYKQYYLSEKWKSTISDRAVNIINNNLDENVVKYFCYSKI